MVPCFHRQAHPIFLKQWFGRPKYPIRQDLPKQNNVFSIKEIVQDLFISTSYNKLSNTIQPSLACKVFLFQTVKHFSSNFDPSNTWNSIPLSQLYHSIIFSFNQPTTASFFFLMSLPQHHYKLTAVQEQDSHSNQTNDNNTKKNQNIIIKSNPCQLQFQFPKEHSTSTKPIK